MIKKVIVFGGIALIGMIFLSKTELMNSCDYSTENIRVDIGGILFSIPRDMRITLLSNDGMKTSELPKRLINRAYHYCQSNEVPPLEADQINFYPTTSRGKQKFFKFNEGTRINWIHIRKIAIPYAEQADNIVEYRKNTNSEIIAEKPALFCKEVYALCRTGSLDPKYPNRKVCRSAFNRITNSLSLSFQSSENMDKPENWNQSFKQVEQFIERYAPDIKNVADYSCKQPPSSSIRDRFPIVAPYIPS